VDCKKLNHQVVASKPSSTPCPNQINTISLKQPPLLTRVIIELVFFLIFKNLGYVKINDKIIMW
jgi:hypothetical protein